jgi:hypothetical protein
MRVGKASCTPSSWGKGKERAEEFKKFWSFSLMLAPKFRIYLARSVRSAYQPPATSRNQPAVLFSQNKPAPAISHQPTEQAVN